MSNITVKISPSTIGEPGNVDLWVTHDSALSKGSQVFSDLSPVDIETLIDALEEA